MLSNFNLKNPVIINAKDFHTNLLQFFDELIGQFPEEGDLIIIRVFLKDKVSILDTINYCCLNILPLKNNIKEKDESIFLDNDALFEKLNKDNVNRFKKLWRSGRLDQKDKDVVWEWLNLFIKLMEKHQKISSSKIND